MPSRTQMVNEKSKPTQIKRIFINYYKDIFNSTNTEPTSDDFRFRSTIDPRDLVGLCHIPFSEEIKEVV